MLVGETISTVYWTLARHLCNGLFPTVSWGTLDWHLNNHAHPKLNSKTVLVISTGTLDWYLNNDAATPNSNLAVRLFLSDLGIWSVTQQYSYLREKVRAVCRNRTQSHSRIYFLQLVSSFSNVFQRQFRKIGINTSNQWTWTSTKGEKNKL